MSTEELQEEVTAEKPDSLLNTIGTDHITIWESNEEDTIEFYRDTLGMPLVLRQPNLDDSSQTHLFFDTGDGTILTVFVSDSRKSDKTPQQMDVGAVHHLCFTLEPDKFEEVQDSLKSAGHMYSVFDRGIFLSLYTRDHNGLTIELTVDKFEYPDPKKGDVLAKAQELREEEGSEYAKEEHLEEALDQLGIDYMNYPALLRLSCGLARLRVGFPSRLAFLPMTGQRNGQHRSVRALVHSQRREWIAENQHSPRERVYSYPLL